jgi:mannose-6-phosphate isomerase-like protein (cupin superfamily)
MTTDFRSLTSNPSNYPNGMRIVTKPWGRELWLALNNYYCYKQIEINAGQATSFQYHNQKIETNYLVSGRAEFWLENPQGEIEKRVVDAPCIMDIPKAGLKHRVIAITDIVLLEASSPHVDDVVRINDEFGRGDGKIQSEHDPR